MIGSIEELVEQGLQYPDSFTTRSEEAYKTHACVFAIHRDSDLLDQSNWMVFCQELGLAPKPDQKPDPTGLDGSFIMRSTHWAVGWVETIFVPVYEPGHDDENCYEPSYSSALLKAYELHEAMSHYPVLDEEDYSEREYADLLDTLVQCYDVPEDRADECRSFLMEMSDVSRSDDIGSHTEGTILEWFHEAKVQPPEWLVRRFNTDDNPDALEAW